MGKIARPYVAENDKVLDEGDLIFQEDSLDDSFVENFIIDKFADDYGISYNTAYRIVHSMGLFEVLIEKYWKYLYKEVTTQGGTK